jgi:hypothetical protein
MDAKADLASSGTPSPTSIWPENDKEAAVAALAKYSLSYSRAKAEKR